jgi:hypothetical protein
MFNTSTFRVAATLAGICLCGPAWALGSTPVTVVNPATMPALTSSVDDPGRIPYQSARLRCHDIRLPEGE